MTGEIKLALILAILSLLVFVAFRLVKVGKDKARLKAQKVGEKAQEAEGEAFREARGGMLERARRRMSRNGDD